MALGADGKRGHAVNAGDEPAVRAQRLGRQNATSRAELSHIALTLFIERGFEQTTVDDIAAAAGIGRRTLFRYFPSKNDLPWGDFDEELDRMRKHLDSLPPDMPIAEALSLAVIEFNSFPAEEIPVHRERMLLLLNVPALVAHSTLRYIAWRSIIADYVARRLGTAATDHGPQTAAWILLGISLASYEQWLQDDDADLTTVLTESFATLRRTFTTD